MILYAFLKKVWLGIGISIVCVTASLIFILRFSSRLPTIRSSNTKVETITNNENSRNREKKVDEVLSDVIEKQSSHQFLYVIGNLLSQGLINNLILFHFKF